MTDGVRRPWRDAMVDALYGETGFYVVAGTPARHFRTSAHASSSWAAAVAELAHRVDNALGRPAEFAIVDVGAGGGELLGALAGTAPVHWQLVGCDVASRPDLPDRVAWLADCPDDVVGLVIATELLDVVPVDVVVLTDDGPRIVEVEPDGAESVGAPLGVDDVSWLAQWWPLKEAGDRAEIGRLRDEVWRSLAGRMARGLAVAVDYAVDPVRDVAGTLTGFRHGRQVMPVPDGSCDLTAHVRFDSLVRDGDVLVSQRDALRALGVVADRPAYDGDARSYLAALSSTGDAAELLDPGGLGGFTWLAHGVDVDPATIIAR